MKATIIIAAMFALATSAQAGERPTVKISTPATFDSRCQDAQKAVRWYRHHYNKHRTVLGFSLAPRLEQAMSCRRVRERARHWTWAAKVNRRLVVKVLAERNRIPQGEAELRAYINDSCLAEIVDRETAGTWNPTVYNYSGSGAYGLPQALPGHKMASAGADWQTNPKTQIAWMRSYVNSRYGGSCSALAHHNSQGWY